jgi:hypothetical protein
MNIGKHPLITEPCNSCSTTSLMLFMNPDGLSYAPWEDSLGHELLVMDELFIFHLLYSSFSFVMLCLFSVMPRYSMLRTLI